MNSVKSQDTKSVYKNHLMFFTLTLNYQEDKLRKQSHLPALKRIKYAGRDFNPGGKRLICWRHWWQKLSEETNKWKRNSTFVNWKNIVKMSTLPRDIYRLDAISINFNAIFHRNRKPILKFVRNHKRSQRAKAILRTKLETSPFLISNYSNQNNMVLP